MYHVFKSYFSYHRLASRSWTEFFQSCCCCFLFLGQFSPEMMITILPRFSRDNHNYWDDVAHLPTPPLFDTQWQKYFKLVQLQIWNIVFLELRQFMNDLMESKNGGFLNCHVFSTPYMRLKSAAISKLAIFLVHRVVLIIS